MSTAVTAPAGDLRDELRAWSENDPDPSYFNGDVLSAVLHACGLASDALAALQARIAEVERERDEARAESLSHQGVRSSLLADARRAERARDAERVRADQLEAENARLREQGAQAFVKAMAGSMRLPDDVRTIASRMVAVAGQWDAERTVLAHPETSTESAGGSGHGG